MRKIIMMMSVVVFIFISWQQVVGFEYKKYDTIEAYIDNRDIDFKYITGELFVIINEALNRYTDVQLSKISSSIDIKIMETSNRKHKEIYSELLLMTKNVIDSQNNVNILQNIYYGT